MQSPEIARLNARRIDAANDLRDADARLESLRDAAAEHYHGMGGREVSAEEMARAAEARRRAKVAHDAAEEDLAAEIAAERIAAEDARRA